ncbi:hypothetical protein ACFOTA_02940 [Chitinophaga sp. GCM10012297]|uniref:Uncharacterized protein n=1 Tax=Chitinophaga chungangae TaxID=2821488 RepID=A0ABS3Y8Y5_9BACT|nr:hypothetical protein [Chitinophaga chungangae]MBO9151147.1 hypothetical protein [Chitinophaga chungangae]
MNKLIWFVFLLFLGNQLCAQKVYQIRADSVRIYSDCDTSELIIENRTKGTPGFLYNKGNGRTEFRKAELERVGDSSLAIKGHDTLDIRMMALFQLGDPLLITRDTVLSPSHRFVIVRNTIQITVTLPPAAQCSGRIFVIKSLMNPWPACVNTVRLNAAIGEKIDNSNGFSACGNNMAVQLYCDGLQWYVIGVYSRNVLA